ncbi:GerMN domain-containing protein [Aliinostoc sp. HNIBRCY26]|uniref:GerMN domain-containing protein n=1 Tax=Aliinostoc sp. HNIBRCY26 TaxID=3418997 RepID=UPI003D047A94
MNDQQEPKRISPGVIAVVSAAVLAVGGGVAWLTANQTQSPPQSAPTQKVEQQPYTTQPGNEQTANIYWLKTNESSVELVPQPIKVAAVSQPNQVLEQALQSLLAGPTEGTNSTTIPQGTKLLGLKVDNNNEIHVNLSEDFTSGGGSTSMVGRVGQVVYTATTLNPNAKVYIEVNNKPLEVLGGEGVEIEQPLTRESFKKDYPLR